MVRELSNMRNCQSPVSISESVSQPVTTISARDASASEKLLMLNSEEIRLCSNNFSLCLTFAEYNKYFNVSSIIRQKRLLQYDKSHIHERRAHNRLFKEAISLASYFREFQNFSKCTKCTQSKFQIQNF